MANSYTVSAQYYAGSEGTITFPEGKSWDDVKDWYVKWDILHVKFKDQNEYQSFQLNSEIGMYVDWKRPISATIHPYIDEDNDTDYDTELASFPE